MSKYQEALDYFLNRDEGDNLTVTCDWLSNAEELQELVDKETPMKPTVEIYRGREVIGCGEVTIDEYCTGCGKK